VFCSIIRQRHGSMPWLRKDPILDKFRRFENASLVLRLCLVHIMGVMLYIKMLRSFLGFA
jgi:hypothetical protein